MLKPGQKFQSGSKFNTGDGARMEDRWVARTVVAVRRRGKVYWRRWCAKEEQLIMLRLIKRKAKR